MKPGSGSSRRTARASGFTLVEVLVALVIVAIGMAVLMSAMASAADTTAYLRDKSLAEWIALNEIAIVRLGTQLPSQGKTEGDLDYAGRKWHWEQQVTPLDFPGMLRLDVKVQQSDTPAGKNAPWLATITGAVGDAVSPPQLTSLFTDYQAAPQGTGATTPAGSNVRSGIASPAPGPSTGTGTGTGTGSGSGTGTGGAGNSGGGT
jgi:general secretion pathway protein I